MTTIKCRATGWGGFDAYLTKVCAIEDIPFADMRKDDILGKWGVVKKFFVGVVAEPVPPAIYNRLLEKIPSAIREKHKLKFAKILTAEGKTPTLSQPPTLTTSHLSGQFPSEEKFEEERIIPLLRRWRLQYKRQHFCPFRIGSQDLFGRVDFYVSDKAGLLTVFEDKLWITNDNDLKPAVAQAKSYALLLGSPSFVVASPERMWLYSLDRNHETLYPQLPGADLNQQEEEFRSLLLRLRHQ
jgi:hypothetical protein